MATKASAGRARRVLIVVQNLPVPFDRRVWLEATTLATAGYRVSVICPKAKGFNRSFEVLEDVHIYRYALPVDAQGTLGFVAEFLWCFLRTAMKSVRVAVDRARLRRAPCLQPAGDLLAAGPLLAAVRQAVPVRPPRPLAGDVPGQVRLLRRAALAGLRFLERKTFETADLVITTNQSHRRIAIERGGKAPGDVYVVRSGPDLQRLDRLPARIRPGARARRHLLVYLGEICKQDGVDHLVRALKLLRDEFGRDDIHCVLVGGGPHQPASRRTPRRSAWPSCAPSPAG